MSASPSSSPPRLATLLHLAWPVITARATQSVIGFSDALLTAPLGEDALAATTTGSFNTFSFVIFPMGTAFMVQSFAAQLYGRGRGAEARRFAWYGLGLALAAGLLSLATIPFLGAMLRPFGYSPNVHHLMTGYLGIRLTAVTAIVGMEVLGNWYGGLGNTRLHMQGGVIAMVSNVFLNWVFIYGHLGAPAMGVNGSALASAIASWLGFFYLALAFRAGWGGAPRQSGPLGLRAAELWRMLRFGVPNGINWFLEFSAFALFINVAISHLGTTTLAALNVVIQINSVAFMPAFGLSTAGAILVGQAVGAGRRDDVPSIVWLTARTAMLWMGAVGLSYFIAPSALIGMFAKDQAQGARLIEVGTTMLLMSSAWQLFDGVGLSVAESLRAAGDTAWCLWARLAIAWLVFTPVAMVVVFEFHGGAVAAIACIIGYLALLSGALYYRFRSGAWRKIDLVGEEQLLADAA